ncbi:DUF2621 family protein [Numidum massiliense]|uniref:DUF2621 family protein n=1 Tax=Numidum massiliense TaxID=1522315 RepID=UPI0006D56CF6|nr:DUF2621 family protein [Numidum massiliense]
MSDMFGTFIVFWMLFLVAMFAIGGYFMFRKFLKSMPKKDGKSALDWQDHYVSKARHLWTEETLAFLEELVQPVPQLFRDTARHSIAAKISQIALEEKAPAMTMDIILRGYIEATPKRDHKWLVAHLQEKQIDITPYRALLDR